MNSEIYKSDFEKFLAHTTEKQVLLDEIKKEISEHNVRSLLDIGAGNGLLADPLSKSVETYQAVEKNPGFVTKLRSRGIEVLEGEFPIDVEGLFDMALFCHSLSYDPGNAEVVLSKAWDKVKPDGVMLLVTYSRGGDDWTRLMKASGKLISKKNAKRYQQILNFVQDLGHASVRKVITTVDTENLDDMLQALAFVASDGIPKLKADFLGKSPQLSEILNGKYKTDSGFSFPFQHFFLTIQKIA